MSFTAGLYCSDSDRLYPCSPDRYVCDETGGPLVVVYDYQQLGDTLESNDFGGSEHGTPDRFAALLPFRNARTLEGLQFEATPLREVDGPGTKSVLWKDESALPTGTTWHRGSAVLRGLLEEWEASLLVCTNLGPAGLATARGLSDDRPMVLVTSGEDRGALARFPERIHRCVVDVDSPRDVTELVLEALDRPDRVFGTPGWNPYYQEGLKTVAFELYEQTRTRPDNVYVAGFSGLPASAIKKGFVELKKIGFLDTIPRVVSVRPGSPGELGELFEETVDAAAAGFDEDRYFPEPAAGIDRVCSVGVDRLISIRNSLGDGQVIGGNPTGLLGLAGVEADGPDGTALVVATGLALDERREESSSPHRVESSAGALLKEFERITGLET